jgi:aryl-alcohol dehydrogenase-like predicted oxidoreductase
MALLTKSPIMQQRPLGKTGLNISVLTIGGLFTSSLAGGATETRRILKRAVDLGINAIDTAPAYADSESTIGQALTGLESHFLMISKLGGRPQPFNARDPKQLQQSVAESLQQLKCDHLDVLLIHEPDRAQQYPWWTSYAPLEGPVLDAINELKSQGQIRFSGLAGTTVTELTALIKSNLFDVVLTAFNYNALFREAAVELLPAATERQMGILDGSVLGQGFLARDYRAAVKQKPVWLSTARQQQFLAYYDLLDQSGLTPVEMGLRFALSNPAISSIPIGCKSIEQLETSVKAIEQGPLSTDILNRLDQIAVMLPYRPFEEPMILPFSKDYFGPNVANVGASVKVGYTSH